MSAAARKIQRSEHSAAGVVKRRKHQAEAANLARASASTASATVQRALLQRGRATPADLISAQRAVGNRALQRLLAEAHERTAQPEGDDHEAQHQTEEQRDEHDLRRAASTKDQGQSADPAVLGRIEEERGNGKPLDSRVAKQVGRKLGADFGGVRIHTSPRADMLNRAMHSKAFTVGRDVFFSRDAYRPTDTKGLHLIAHELIHVVQQGGDKSEKVQAKFSVAPAGDQFERVADRAAPHIAPRPGAPASGNARPAFGREAPSAIPDRTRLKPGSRAGVVQRAPAGSPAATGDSRKAKDLRKGDIVLSRRRVLDLHHAPGGGAEPGAGQPAGLLLEGFKGHPRIPQGRAFEMIQRLWNGSLRKMSEDFFHSALAFDQKNIVHTLDAKQIRRDSEETLSGSEVYRSEDKRLAENSVETTKQWGEIGGKLRKAHEKATSALDLTAQHKSQAAVLAAYALAGKLTPKALFSEEFTTVAHQATALMPGLQQLIDSEAVGPGKGGRNSWGKAKGSQKGIKGWVQRNLSKIKLPDRLPIDPQRVLPEKLPSAIHYLAVKSRPKWHYEGLL